MLESPLNPIQRLVMLELHRTLGLLGARDDLLAIFAGWEASQGDRETLSELSRWNDRQEVAIALQRARGPAIYTETMLGLCKDVLNRCRRHLPADSTERALLETTLGGLEGVRATTEDDDGRLGSLESLLDRLYGSDRDRPDTDEEASGWGEYRWDDHEPQDD
jgi:hypothetical protein